MAAERRARAWALLAPAVATLAACIEPTRAAELPGYDPALPSGQIYHWPLARTIRVYVDDAALPAATDLRAATRDAMAAWRAVLLYREHEFDLTSDLRVADVIVRVAGAPRRVGTASCDAGAEGAAGRVFFCRAGLAEPQQDTALTLPLLVGGPGRLKVEITVDPALAPPSGLVSLVAHELGHALGIGAHSPHAGDLMHAAPRVARPSERDAATLRWLLHLRADLRL